MVHRGGRVKGVSAFRRGEAGVEVVQGVPGSRGIEGRRSELGEELGKGIQATSRPKEPKEGKDYAGAAKFTWVRKENTQKCPPRGYEDWKLQVEGGTEKAETQKKKTEKVLGFPCFRQRVK